MVWDKDVWIRLVGALLAADPLGGAMFVIVAVAEQAVAQRAEGVAMFIIAAFQASKGQVISVHMQQADGAQGFQVIVNVAQDFLVAFARISQQFADLEFGKPQPERLETGDGEQMVIDVGRGAGTGEGPEQKKAVINDVEGLGFVAEAVFAFGLGRLLRLGVACFGSIGVRAGAVRARIVDIGRIRIAGSGKAAVFPADFCIAGATFLASFPSRTGAH